MSLPSTLTVLDGASAGNGASSRQLSSSRSSQNLSDSRPSTTTQFSTPSYAQHPQAVPSSASSSATSSNQGPKLARTPSMTPSTSYPTLNSMLPSQSITPQNITSLHHHHASQASISHAVALPPLTTKPAVIEHGNYRFCIHDAPTDSNLPAYVDFLIRKKTVALVRACEATYDKTPLQQAGIRVLELSFQDGSPPPDAMITQWLHLVNEVFGPFNANGAISKEDKKKEKEKNKAAAAAAGSTAASASTPKSSATTPAIACHCVAGLGRAPVLVCIALIESGMTWMQSVELVRKKRRGALNATQLTYLETYKPRGKKDSCVIQ